MSVEQITELFGKLNATTTPEDRTGAAAALVAAAKAKGPTSLPAIGEQLKAAIDTEAGLVAFKAIAEEFGKVAEPYLFPLLPNLLERVADKSASIRTAVEEAAKALFAILNPYSTRNSLPPLFDAMGQARNWQSKVLALTLLAGMAKTAPTQIATCLSDIVPRLTDCMADAKEQVKAATHIALTETFAVNGNRDITKFLPALIGCIARPVSPLLPSAVVA